MAVVPIEESWWATVSMLRGPVAAGVVAACMAADAWRRFIPASFALGAVILGCVTGGWAAVITVIGCVVIVWLADYPGGDLRGIGAMAAWMPSAIMVPALLVAMLASAFTLHRWHARAATWPWLVMVGGAIIGIAGLRAILGVR